VGACGTPIGVTRVDPRIVHRSLTANVLSTGRPSGPTRNVLHRRYLYKRFEDEPERALAELHRIAVAEGGDTEDLFALAELSFLLAEQRAKRRGERRYYLSSAVYAYAYLFPGDGIEPPSPFDPRFRLACDLYNRGITAGFQSEERSRVALAPGVYDLPFGALEVEVDRTGFRWADRELVEFIPVAELDVRGLRNRYRRPGIGAPLAAGTDPTDERRSQGLIGPRVKVPVTAFLRLNAPRSGLVSGKIHGVLELYAASDADWVTIGDQRIPLEVEPTSTLAYMLTETPLWEQEIARFLGRKDVLIEPPLLGALEPYRPGRIPVVLVHGTVSSPARWAEMVNELYSHQRIRERFQFWFFLYDTGNPIAYSALLLRDDLSEQVQRLEATKRDPCLYQMVVIGHSQGGLLTKMTAIDAGDRLWNNVSRRPFTEVAPRLSPENRELVRRTLFVKPLPFVRRLIFIATPHRGSFVAGKRISHMAARLIKLPGNVAGAASDLVRGTESGFGVAALDGIPTSVDNMTPGHPFIETLSSIPVVEGVTTHSIIPVRGEGPPEEGNDGVVEYLSAHLQDAASELIVRSGHSTQSHPYTIAEVRRILLEHAPSVTCKENAGP
jgi:pimeloyl-ACP methyl ester carboxylesterase